MHPQLVKNVIKVHHALGGTLAFWVYGPDVLVSFRLSGQALWDAARADVCFYLLHVAEMNKYSWAYFIDADVVTGSHKW